MKEVKVILRDEGLWVLLIYGTENKGVGFLLNEPLDGPAKFGDLVTFVSPSPRTEVARVVNIMPYGHVIGYNIKNLRTQDKEVAKKFYERTKNNLEKAYQQLQSDVTRCAICEKPTKIFLVSDEEWQTYVPSHLQKAILCKKCYEKLKESSYLMGNPGW